MLRQDVPEYLLLVGIERQESDMSIRIQLTRLGSRLTDNDIEPSCGVLDVFRRSEHIFRIVVDCGSIPVHPAVPFQPKDWRLPRLSFFEGGRPIDAVCLTHAHGDHAMALPLLAPYLAPGALVWMTMPTCMALRVFFETERQLSRKRGPGGSRLTLCGPAQIGEIQSRIEIIPRPGVYEILPGLKVYVHPEGHVPGACSFTFRIGRRNVHYAGDRCSHDQPGILGGRPLPEAWRPHVIANSDCTYGADRDSDTRTWPGEMARCRDLVAQARGRNAPVLCCAFGLHRGGAIVEGLQPLGLTNIWLDGSCRQHTSNALLPQCRWSDSEPPLAIDNVDWIEWWERDLLAGCRSPYVVVSTPGMGGPGGAAAVWKREILPNPDGLIVFTGYLAPGSDGARIMAAAAERERTGIVPELDFEDHDDRGPMISTLPIACQVAQIRAGSHDSRRGILHWFWDYSPEMAVLCHGSAGALASLQEDLSSFIPHLVLGGQETIEIEI